MEELQKIENNPITQLDVINTVEPLLSNRWLIEIKHVDSKFITNFKIKSIIVGNEIKTILSFDVFNDVQSLHLPIDVINNRKIKINFLDQTNTVVDYFNLDVKLKSVKLVGDYSNCELLKYRVKFWVECLSNRKDEELDNEIKENYIKQQEKTN